jgi:hypothetical protein
MFGTISNSDASNASVGFGELPKVVPREYNSGNSITFLWHSVVSQNNPPFQDPTTFRQSQIAAGGGQGLFQQFSTSSHTQKLRTPSSATPRAIILNAQAKTLHIRSVAVLIMP